MMMASNLPVLSIFLVVFSLSYRSVRSEINDTTIDDEKVSESDELAKSAIDEIFNGKFSALDVSPETIENFHDKIRRKFSILDLRPKDACPSPHNPRFRSSMFYCPTPNPYNVLEWKCVMTDELCNGIPDCPGSEDEDPTLCLYWLASQEQLRQIRKILVRHIEKDSEQLFTNPKPHHLQQQGHQQDEHQAGRFSMPFRSNRLH